MSRILLFWKVILFITLTGILLYVVKYARDIRELFSDNTNKSVAGATTSFEAEVKDDLVGYLNTLKYQLLNIKIKDIIQPLSRMGRIGEDLGNVKNEIKKEIDEVTKK